MDKSHTAMSLGVLVFAGVAVSMIMFFYWSGHGKLYDAQLCFAFSKLGLQLLLVICIVLGNVYMRHFESDLDKSNTLDHMLLFIPYVFLISLELFSIISMATYIDSEEDGMLVTVALIGGIFTIIQSTGQIAFIVDGMQKITVQKDHLEKKRGRGVITLLVIVNVAMWAFKSFQEKQSDQSFEVHIYGELAWMIISNVALPLELFFYFHSAICLAHMWTHCYEEPGSEEPNNTDTSEV